MTEQNTFLLGGKTGTGDLDRPKARTAFLNLPFVLAGRVFNTEQYKLEYNGTKEAILERLPKQEP